MSGRPKIMFLVGGSAGHGKDSFAGFLNEVIEPWSNVYTTAYAHGIKKILHQTYGVPWKILNGDKDVKESTYVYTGDQKTPVTVRRALQKIGQFHRETFGPTCWAASTLTRCKASNARVCIVTDARHPIEEIHWIGEQAATSGFLVVPVRVRRSSVPVNPDHLSESLILKEPDESFSFLVENEGTLDDLKNMAEQVACAAVILQKTGKKKVKREGSGWIACHSNGHLPYEPLLTKEDAEMLAQDALRVTGEAYYVRPVDLDMLSGVACFEAGRFLNEAADV